MQIRISPAVSIQVRHLFYRNGVYYYRRRLPQEVAAQLGTTVIDPALKQ